MRRFLAPCANLFRWRRAEREMAREIEAHLRLIVENLERSGMPPDQARRTARLSYGAEQAKESHREARTFVRVEQLVRDLRYACRNLLHAPGFTLLAIVAPAIGLGVNLTVFATYDALVLKPLPVADPSHVVRLKRIFGREMPKDPFYFSLADYQRLRDHAGAFSGVVASQGPIAAMATIGASSTPERLAGRAVSANYFAVLGETPLVGRFFRPEEGGASGSNPVVVLTWSFWQRRFDGNPHVLGQTLRLNGSPYTAVGIAPKGFTGTDFVPVEFDYWTPLTGAIDARVEILARLQTGIPRAQARDEATVLLRKNRMDAISLEPTRYLDMDDPGDRAGFQAAAVAMEGVAWLILAAACANAANMLLARGAARQKEVAIRLAMGAGRGRVVRQLLLESVLLALAATAAAMPLALPAGRWMFEALNMTFQTMKMSMPMPDFRLDARLLAFGAALAILTGVLFGLWPALRFTRLDLHQAMKEEGSLFGMHFRRSRLRSTLLASQAAVSLLLVLVSGAILTRFHRASVLNPGFDIHNAYVLDLENAEKGAADLPALRDRLTALPQIGAVAIGEPPSGNDDRKLALTAGKWSGPAFASAVSDGYFETLGMHFVRGRGFGRSEATNHAPVAVITESTARLAWPGEDPIGKRLTLAAPPKPSFEVIGVVNDGRQSDLIRIDPLRVYFPGITAGPDSAVLFRIRGDRTRALAAVESTVGAIDRKLLPELKLYSVGDGNIAALRTFYRAVAQIAGSLSLLAVILAVIGIYGVVAFLVSQRTREIGIRVALGATACALLQTVLTEGMRPVLIGMAFGFAAAVGLDVWFHSSDLLPEPLLHRAFGDPAVAAELAIMLGIAAVASMIPARRVLRVDPMRALRHE